MTGPVAEVSRRSVAPLLILVQVQAGSPIIVDAAHTTKAVSAHNWAPDLLFSEPSFRLSRGPKRSPSLNFARVRRAGVVEGLSCYLPMRFVSIGQPHVHHERISVVCAFDPNRARLWFQSHRDKSHFPNYPVVAKNLRLEGTSAFRSRRRRMIAPGDSIEGRRIRSAQHPNPCLLPALIRIRFPRWPVSGQPPEPERTSGARALQRGAF